MLEKVFTYLIQSLKVKIEFAGDGIDWSNDITLCKSSDFWLLAMTWTKINLF